jgi:hypothetical protein
VDASGALVPEPVDLTLPTLEAVDNLPATSVPGFLAQLAALQLRAAARLALPIAPTLRTAPLPPYTLREAAALLCKSPAWLRRLACAGKTPSARKVGRSWVFDRAGFDRFCTAQQVG